MDNKHHEHKMVPVDYPAVSHAKKTCFFVLAVLVVIAIVSMAIPEVAMIVHTYQYWIVGGLGGIVGIAFIGACIQAFSR
jgi:hypothetical protein